MNLWGRVGNYEGGGGVDESAAEILVFFVSSSCI